MTTNVAKLVNERTAELHRRGTHGPATYHELAVDPSIPANLEVEDICAITGDTPSGLKQRRQRGQAPAFLRLSGKRVVYPRFDFFMWLADRYVVRRAARAADTYAHQPSN